MPPVLVNAFVKDTDTASPGIRSSVGSKLNVVVPAPLYVPCNRFADSDRCTTKSVCPAAVIGLSNVAEMDDVFAASASFLTGATDATAGGSATVTFTVSVSVCVPSLT